ncbi:MAG: exodeoxyribonuclease VII small subunit, partial [Clostridia bacterium]|nr:exodeoxyribonuclease VII small subunit [Clostridia bacterium]
SLEESFKAYEKGVKLASQLKAVLDQGDQRILALTESLSKTDITGEVTQE